MRGVDTFDDEAKAQHARAGKTRSELTAIQCPSSRESGRALTRDLSIASTFRDRKPLVGNVSDSNHTRTRQSALE
jgi:hypothetical protein